MAFSKDDSPPDSSVHGISRARILEWLPFPSPVNLPTQGWNSSVLHWQVDSLPLSHQGSRVWGHCGFGFWSLPLSKSSPPPGCVFRVSRRIHLPCNLGRQVGVGPQLLSDHPTRPSVSFWMLILSQFFHSPLSSSSRASFIPLLFLP